MKRKTTKEILVESFRELAGSESVDKITVQEIVDNCDYSTATFYRHFKDKYDLIAWDYAQKTAEIMGRINGKDYSWAQTREMAQSTTARKRSISRISFCTRRDMMPLSSTWQISITENRKSTFCPSAV